MRGRIVRAALVLACLVGASIAFAYSTGPPVPYTGAPAVGAVPPEGVCRACHSGNPLNDPRAKLEILDLPGQYAPGQTILMRVRLSFNWGAPPPVDNLWGFEMTAVAHADGQGAGTFDVLTDPGPMDGMLQIRIPSQTSAFKTRRYIQHTSAGTQPGNPGGVEWLVRWVAPATDVGQIDFYAAGNSANGDGSNQGDYIATASAFMLGGVTLDVPPGPTVGYTTELDPAYPNPFSRFADFSFSVSHPSEIDIGVFDLQGRRIKTLRRGPHPGGPDGTQWNGDLADGSRAPNGFYFVRLVVAGEKPVFSKVSLSR